MLYVIEERPCCMLSRSGHAECRPVSHLYHVLYHTACTTWAADLYAVCKTAHKLASQAASRSCT
jgi:hypothetical protein